MKEVRNATHVKRKGVIALLVVKTDDTIASFLFSGKAVFLKPASGKGTQEIIRK